MRVDARRGVQRPRLLLDLSPRDVQVPPPSLTVRTISLSTKESLPGVKVIIAHTETKGPLGDSHLGEVRWRPRAPVTSAAAPPAVPPQVSLRVRNPLAQSQETSSFVGTGRPEEPHRHCGSP